METKLAATCVTMPQGEWLLVAGCLTWTQKKVYEIDMFPVLLSCLQHFVLS